MNFIYKAYIQKLFSTLPKGEKLNYVFQKYVTKSLPILDSDFVIKLEAAKSHFNNFKKYGSSKNPEDCTYYEFGAGYDMLIPLSMSILGFKKLICIDIRELIFPELIKDSINRLRKFKDKLGKEISLSENIPSITGKNYKDILKKFFRIEYMAPLDARNTHIEKNSIDFILSNATMEHIPENDISPIMKECYRILTKNGIMSNVIDYRDHWSFFDSSISVYNYLKFSDNKWLKLNPSIMYQNRMRHKDYIKIIKDTGFEILEETANKPNEKELDELKNIRLDKDFSNNYSKEELSIKSSILVIKKFF
ncbi:MAG: class I SAM-dependent methyltransferase [Bacteroidota bacterium]|nr:class I SAM-dependent methyltransferase [Bacteroidota bacterium]